MPDISEQLSAILQNPEAQQNIRNLLSSLQQGPSAPEQKSEAPPFDFMSAIGGSPPSDKNNPFSGIDINMLMKLQGIFSKMSCDDQNVNLLLALKPHLREPKKVDDAINILRLISILPALDESGFFGGGHN